MNVGDYQQLESAFVHAAGLEGEPRREYVRTVRASNPSVGDRLEAMLTADTTQSDRALDELVGELTRAEPQADQRIGEYRVLGLIGEGGLGIVYLAEQPPPTRRLVAIKVIKPGMDTRAVLARFNDERQALAMMDHAALVTALSAGTTSEGRPYLVMPLVAGIPITAFCREQGLGTRAIAELFMLVCNGVQHAHGKGVLHRDLKPGNILVSVVDGRPQPKIIDFGLAKALATPLTTHTTMTLEGQLIGTLEYMSPEQATGRGMDTRSDVYALGAILYETLAGRPPFSANELRTGKGADHARQLIAERLPEPPSRHIEGIPRELDWIVQRCLEKDPGRRYSTAESVGADLQRFVGGDRVVAGPPAQLYRLGQWTKRHRGIVIAASLSVAAIVLGGAVAIAYGVRERRARQDTEQVATFLEGIFTGLNPVVAQGRDRELLLLALDQAEARLSQQVLAPPVDARVSKVLATSFLTIGEYGRAAPHAERSLTLNRQLFGVTDSRSIAALRVWVEVLSADMTNHDPTEAAQELWQIAQSYLPVGSRERIESQFIALKGDCLEPLVISWEAKMRHEADLQASAEASLGPADRLTLRIMRERARAMQKPAEAALNLLMEARQRASDKYGPDDPDVEVGVGSESYYIAQLKGEEAAANYLIEHLPRVEQLLGSSGKTLFVCHYNLSFMLLSLGRLSEAEEHIRAVSAYVAQHFAEPTQLRNETDALSMIVCLRMHRLEEAAMWESRIWDRVAVLTARTGNVPWWSGGTLETAIEALDDQNLQEHADRFLEMIRVNSPSGADKIAAAREARRRAK